MKKFSQILINSKYIFLTNFTEKVVFFIFFLILARQLDKSSFGLVTTVFAFCNIINSFFDLGSSFYIQRESDADGINNKMSAAFTLKILGALLFSTIIIIYLYIYVGIGLSIIFVIAALTYLNGFNVLLNAYLYGRKKYKISYYSFIISRSLFLATILYFFFTNSDNYLILISLMFSVILHFILLLYVTTKEGINVKLTFDQRSIKSIIKSSLPFGVATTFVLMYDKFDVLLLERILSLESVAIYSIAYSLYKLPHILSNIILTPVYTDFSHSFRDSYGIKRSDITSISSLLLTVSLLSIIIIYFFGENILLLLYGSKYMNSVQYFKILIFALPALYLNNLTGVISNSVRKEKIPMYVNGLGVVLNITFNVIGILLFGIWGAVFATIITEYCVFIVQAIILRNYNINSNFILQH